MIRETTLYFKSGTSDKVYYLGLEQADDGYVVLYANARRGAKLEPKRKTPAPVTLKQAEQVFDSTMQEKLSKGYQPGSNNVVPPEAQVEAVQLLEHAEPVEVSRLLVGAWWMQQKHDGKRMQLHKRRGVLAATNKRGVPCTWPEWLVPALAKVQAVTLDGELVGDRYYAFDVLTLGGTDIRTCTYRERYDTLRRLGESFGSGVGVVLTATTLEQKETMLRELLLQRAEGVVFKDPMSKYTAGRQRTWLKHKFTKSLSAVVSKQNVKRSVALTLEDTFVGDVSVPVNHELPPVGAVVEIEYLYAFEATGKLFQPVYKGVRDDVLPAECKLSQRIFKAEDE